MGILLSMIRMTRNKYMVYCGICGFVAFYAYSSNSIKNKISGIIFGLGRLCKYRKGLNNLKKTDDTSIEELHSHMLTVESSAHLPVIDQPNYLDDKFIQKTDQIDRFDHPDHVVINVSEHDNITKTVILDRMTILDRITILHNLKILTELVDNQKPWLSGKKLEVYSSWIPGMRWMYSQSRTVIMPCIKDTVISAIILKNNSDQEVANLLNTSVTGLEKLKITYNTEHNDIDELILSIKN
jgi:hypothetical protein